MKTITPDYVTFETAKLLKEKGFLWKGTQLRKNEEGKLRLEIIGDIEMDFHNGYPAYNEEGNPIRPNKFTYNNPHYPRPTQALVTKWIRNRFGIDIHAKRQYKRPFYVGEPLEYKWCAMIDNEHGNGPAYYDSFGELNTPEAAIEEAIKYVLKKMI